MPISDNSNYPEGHFQRVYEHLIIPACENAGFTPIRADDVINTNYIAIDVIKKIIESEMVLCDLSSQNPNVLYELGIRQAFNKPVSLIKDKKTKRIFDIQGFRDFEYDETLRVDNVETNVEKLSQVLISTYEEKNNDINSLVSLLSLNPAKIENTTELSTETKLILNSISGIDKRLNSLENNSKTDVDILPFKKSKFYGGGEINIIPNKKLPENVGNDFSRKEIEELKKGDSVYHNKFGFGEVLEIEKSGSTVTRVKGNIRFNDFGIKKLLLDFAKLKKVL
ncbi:hypothetical protein N8858_03815 [Flavobacteriaceae bacterium]|mgnify:CR=1 FL=1|jgi:hypothetical protein|nr:hypothetical protein [Flavobacteriaceae bacterium]